MATNHISAELIAKAFRMEDPQTGETYYNVDSRSEYGVSYIVRYDRGHRVLTCTCPAGNPPVDAHGFPTYAPRHCWHLDAALAHSKQYKAEQAHIARYEHIEKLEAMGLTREEAEDAASAKLIVNGKPADDETLVRVFGPSPKRPSEQEMNRLATQAHTPRPFAICR